ncbi:MAG TPA: hypothetical protein VHU83_15830 [Bryobacteraceae bacterium]|nr:hypothetical protein [Bryobacteraceae bacterium]
MAPQGRKQVQTGTGFDGLDAEACFDDGRVFVTGGAPEGADNAPASR